VIRTRRLVLRPLRTTDEPALRALGRRRPLAMPTGTTLAITLRGGTLIGAVGLVISAKDGHGELGYWLGARHRGRGYATEAAEALVRWGFRRWKLRRVFAQVLGGNTASIRVLEKLGFLREGVRRKHIRKAGRWYDAHQFGLLREEVSWRTRS
jgi:RimJ/RimL family protein N-acetyltransferase